MEREEYSWYRWQIIRREPTYVRFCRDHNDAFVKLDKENPDDPLVSILDPSYLDVSSRQEAEKIKERFGLEMIYHPSVEIPKDRVLVWPVFEKERAVDYESRKIAPNLSTPIWNDHYVRLTIDISKTDTQIRRDAFEIIDWARERAETKDTRSSFKSLNQACKIWDLHKEGKTHTEIIKAMWPEEYERQSEDDSEKNKRFNELSQKYQNNGLTVAKAADRAWDDICGDEDKNTGRGKLYGKVRDSLKRMENLFQRVQTD